MLFPLVGGLVAAERATIKEGGRIISRLLLSLRLCGNTTTKRKRKKEKYCWAPPLTVRKFKLNTFRSFGPPWYLSFWYAATILSACKKYAKKCVNSRQKLPHDKTVYWGTWYLSCCTWYLWHALEWCICYIWNLVFIYLVFSTQKIVDCVHTISELTLRRAVHFFGLNVKKYASLVSIRSYE